MAVGELRLGFRVAAVGEEIGTPTASDRYEFGSTYRDSTTGSPFTLPWPL